MRTPSGCTSGIGTSRISKGFPGPKKSAAFAVAGIDRGLLTCELSVPSFPPHQLSPRLPARGERLSLKCGPLPLRGRGDRARGKLGGGILAELEGVVQRTTRELRVFVLGDGDHGCLRR